MGFVDVNSLSGDYDLDQACIGGSIALEAAFRTGNYDEAFRQYDALVRAFKSSARYGSDHAATWSVQLNLADCLSGQKQVVQSQLLIDELLAHLQRLFPPPDQSTDTPLSDNVAILLRELIKRRKGYARDVYKEMRYLKMVNAVTHFSAIQSIVGKYFGPTDELYLGIASDLEKAKRLAKRLKAKQEILLVGNIETSRNDGAECLPSAPQPNADSCENNVAVQAPADMQAALHDSSPLEAEQISEDIRTQPKSIESQKDPSGYMTLSALSALGVVDGNRTLHTTSQTSPLTEKKALGDLEGSAIGSGNLEALSLANVEIVHQPTNDQELVPTSAESTEHPSRETPDLLIGDLYPDPVIRPSSAPPIESLRSRPDAAEWQSFQELFRSWRRDVRPSGQAEMMVATVDGPEDAQPAQSRSDAGVPDPSRSEQQLETPQSFPMIGDVTPKSSSETPLQSPDDRSNSASSVATATPPSVTGTYPDQEPPNPAPASIHDLRELFAQRSSLDSPDQSLDWRRILEEYVAARNWTGNNSSEGGSIVQGSLNAGGNINMNRNETVVKIIVKDRKVLAIRRARAKGRSAVPRWRTLLSSANHTTPAKSLNQDREEVTQDNGPASPD